MSIQSEKFPLRPYQERAIDWLFTHPQAFLAVDMGLGKTRIVLEHLKNMRVKAFVVAPLRVALNTWPAEIAKWAPELSYTVLHGKDKAEKFKLDRDIYIINYDGLQWFLNMVEIHGRSKLHGRILVLDESTMIKAPKAKRTKVIMKLRPCFSRAIALSATPSPNGAHDLWSQYLALDYGRTLGSRYVQFFNRYFVVTPARQVKPKYAGVARDIASQVAPVTFRLDAEDHLKLPDFIDNDIWIDLPPKVMQMYKDFEQDFILQLSEATQINALTAASLSMKLRQVCQGGLYTESGHEIIHSAKLDALEELITGLNGNPALVPIQFKFELEELTKHFGKIPAIVGGLSAKDSNKIIDQWNAGDIPFLVCHPASLSHGVNLQAGGHNIIWLALTWNYEHYSQLNGRLRRQGQTNTVVRTRLLCNNTLEGRIAKVINKKGISQQQLLDALRD